MHNYCSVREMRGNIRSKYEAFVNMDDNQWDLRKYYGEYQSFSQRKCGSLSVNAA
jgi:hypothetical protein